LNLTHASINEIARTKPSQSVVRIKPTFCEETGDGEYTKSTPKV